MDIPHLTWHASLDLEFNCVQRKRSCVSGMVRDMPRLTWHASHDLEFNCVQRKGPCIPLVMATVLVRMLSSSFFWLWLLQQCFDKAEDHVDDAQLKERKMTKDEWVHGSLLIINELLRCSNVEGEVSGCMAKCSLSTNCSGAAMWRER